ncbi:MAG TPA: hypothetical protein VKT77_05590 [Chthonomonadaceae bacterium]|nr:hypothetical protein [Chthonomonadaceae bacterium]
MTWPRALIMLALAASAVLAEQSGIQRGKIKRIELSRMEVTITAGGADRTFTVTQETRIFGAESLPLGDRFKTLHEGEEIFFKPSTRDGRVVLEGIKAVDGPSPTPAAGAPAPFDASRLKPLTELGAGAYHGFRGGLYPDGKNDRPAVHERAGVALARTVRPLDTAGHPDPAGKIALLSVGMSNTSQASDGFARQLAGCAERSPRLVFVNGAQGGMTAKMTQSAEDGGSGQRYWNAVDERLRAAGASRAQVQVVWIKQADAGPTEGFPRYAETLEGELGNIARTLHARFPNLKLAYLSSRTFGGFARSRLNPEPYAYESGFSVKWLIEKQINGDPQLNFYAARGQVRAPWLSWGPYIWANGSVHSTQALPSTEADFAGDGTHESPAGQDKVGRALLHFFLTDTTTRPWFTATPVDKR